MESRGRGSLPRCGERAGPGSEAAAGAPLYKRLPHGPHRLARSEVVRHQRLRIHGAIVEVVAERGYQATSVKRVVALAGVSRRSFYEQFANKQECFLATIDLIAKRELQRIAVACRDGEGAREQRLLAALERLTETARSEPKAAGLVLVEAQAAGAAGTLRLQRAIGGGEQLLRAGLGDQQLPAPVIAAIAGGVHGALATRLRSATPIDGAGLAAELLDWTLLLDPACAERMRETIGPRFARSMRELSRASARRTGTASAATRGDVRERLLQSTLRVNALEGYANLSAARIADQAGIGSDQLFASFADSEACLLAALEMLAAELCAVAAVESASPWPLAVRHALERLLCRLAQRPLYARTIAQAGCCASPEALARSLALAPRLAAQLTAGAPAPRPGGDTVAAIAGAFAHLLRCQLAGARLALLPALADHLAYVVLAPFIGPDAALAALAEDLRA